uniref:Polygalacturonase n=1 Tax=Ananas comosus var. bracteatus TaxID=296719 RepID=A0A6V7PJX8_ANACO|nr:unnamed protein product [Ananas comosus var. bracteatus]
MSLTIAESNNILISGLSTVNSEGFHISIFGSNGVTVQGAKITALSNSPNTDGIHIQMSSDVIVTSSSIKTGDDCTSIGEGTSNVWIEKINCGTSHGISSYQWIGATNREAAPSRARIGSPGQGSSLRGREDRGECESDLGLGSELGEDAEEERRGRGRRGRELELARRGRARARRGGGEGEKGSTQGTGAGKWDWVGFG